MSAAPLRMQGPSWNRSPMRGRVLFIMLSLMIAFMGCGRKLPPLPPAKPDPVEVISIKFVGTEVVAHARCNMPNTDVVLLGKPKGICPNCTDDLIVKQNIPVEKSGEVVLKDSSPASDYMVYRIAVEHGTTKWITPAQIVVK